MRAPLIRLALVSDIQRLWSCDPCAETVPGRKQCIERAVNEGLCWVAEVEGEIVGFVTANRHFFERDFISLIVVDSSFRRCGIGRQLVQAVEAACTRGKLFTSCNQSNVVAQAFLLAAGFARSGVVENLDLSDPEYIYFKELLPHGG